MTLPDARRPAGYRLFLGRSELSPQPKWRDSDRRIELDAVASRAIHLVPSHVQGCVLLEGRMDILTSGYYEERGLDAAPLKNWFAIVRRSLEKSIHVKGARLVVLQSVRDCQPIPSKRRVLIPSEAIAWRRGGGELRQAPEGVVQFDVVLPNSGL